MRPSGVQVLANQAALQERIEASVPALEEDKIGRVNPLDQQYGLALRNENSSAKSPFALLRLLALRFRWLLLAKSVGGYGQTD